MNPKEFQHGTPFAFSVKKKEGAEFQWTPLATINNWLHSPTSAVTISAPPDITWMLPIATQHESKASVASSGRNRNYPATKRSEDIELLPSSSNGD
jgi:hypothetical protein